MNTGYILACGIVWRKTADPEAGWELVDSLESGNPEVRLLAQTLLVQSGQNSMDLLEKAVEAGVISPIAAGPCMAEILRIRHGQQGAGRPPSEPCSEASVPSQTGRQPFERLLAHE